MAPQRAGRDITKQMLRHRQMVLDQMLFKQKAEEKKMSMSKNIARLAVTAGLTAALSFGGVMAPVTMAFAAGTPVATTSGNVTIKDDDYAGTTFKGIKIFSATVTQNQTSADVWDSTGEKTLSDITWASPYAETAVKSVFADATDKPVDTATAQDWADYITEKAGDNVGEKVKVDADSVLDKIAKALEGVTTTNETTGWKTSTSGKFNNLSAGYWLFVTAQPGSTKDTNKTNGSVDAYTSPIFTIVGGADVNAEPKKGVPNVTKAVKDDKNGTFGTDVFMSPNKSADSRMDQYIEYQLTGTVASNINTYSTYKYTFTDKLPKSMTPMFTGEVGSTTPAVTVKIDGKTVRSDGYSKAFSADNVLTVSFTNLKACFDEKDNPITVSESSHVTVEYQAKLDSAKIFVNGKDGEINPEFNDLVGKPQENTVTLTYSNNPHADGTGTTVEHPAYDFTYGIDVTKVGSETANPPLAGVVFTLQEQSDAADTFIMANGTKTTDSKQAKLTTDSEGKINVVGLDEGTYTLKEVTPAPGYNNSAANGVTFTIKSTFDQTGKNVTLTSSTIDAGNGVVKDNTLTAEAGKLSFTIVDQKGSGLPLTGLNGVTFTWIAGGAVLCIGVAHLIRSRKQAEESEQE